MPKEFFLMMFALLCCASYLIGSIPFGYIYTKYFAGIDIRTLGSHSTGTTNVLRTGSKKLALITLLSDALKGGLVAYVGLSSSVNMCLCMSSFCIIGHVFPVWLKFKGGKGAATAAGIFLILSPMATLISAIIWAVVAKITKKSSIASFVFCVSFIVVTIIKFVLGSVSLNILIYSIVVFIFLLFTHRENIKRLLKRKELNV